MCEHNFTLANGGPTTRVASEGSAFEPLKNDGVINPLSKRIAARGVVVNEIELFQGRNRLEVVLNNIRRII